MQSIIIRNWKGEEKLWKVFLIWNFLVAIVLSLFSEIISLITLLPVALQVGVNKNLHGITFPKVILAFVGIFVIIFSLAYFIWALVSLWRSAFNSSKKILGYLARLWVIAVLFFSIVAPVLGIIYPNSIFDDFDDDDLIIEPGEFNFEQKAPTVKAWSKITIGHDKRKVEEILGSSPLKIDRDDGISIWSYWSYKYDKEDDPILFMIPWGKVYKIYFDSFQKVSKKEIINITKEEALKKKDEIEYQRENELTSPCT